LATDPHRLTQIEKTPVKYFIFHRTALREAMLFRLDKACRDRALAKTGRSAGKTLLENVLFI